MTSYCGTVALVGAPNAGKSTLINTLVGEKISIVSPKAQTTRTRVLGILTEGDVQLILIDTPGLFQPKKTLERAIVHSARQGLGDADRVAVIVDASDPRAVERTGIIIQALEKAHIKPAHTVLILNKIDQIHPEKLLPMIGIFNEKSSFHETFMVSAKTGDGIDILKKGLFKILPAGPFLYDSEQLTDMPDRLLAAEITREQIFMQLHEELPYSMTVETESWETFDDGSFKINQIIFVERDSQRSIVLGAKGSRIKEIGSKARKELEKLLGHKVHLKLHVSVKPNWTQDQERYIPWNLDVKAQ